MTAYEKKAVHDIFLSTVEWFEKYIEIVYKKEFPNWESRKQIRDNLVITRKDIYENPKKVEEGLASQLHLFSSVLEEDTSIEFEKEMKQELYKWISIVGIDMNNCPERLRNFIFGLNEIFEGNYEKIRHDIANRKREIEVDDPKYMDAMMNVFSHAQVSMHKEAKIEKSMESIDPNEMRFNNFGEGNSEQGQQVFEQITKSVADSHEDFYFKEQKGQQKVASSSGGGVPPIIPPTNLDEIIKDVKNNPQNWRLDEVITELSNFAVADKQEIMLILRDARLNDYNQEGKLNFNGNPIYRWETFNAHQRFEIKKALKISGEYLTNDEIRWIVKEVKNDPSIWKIETIEGKIYLVHSSAWIKNNEIGTLIHDKKNFSNWGWVQIERVLNGVSSREIELEDFYNKALWKRDNWKDEDYRRNNEDRKGLEKWIKELEVRRSIGEWAMKEEIVQKFYHYGEYREKKDWVLFHKSAKLDFDRNSGQLIADDQNKIFFKNGSNKYFSDKQWNRIQKDWVIYEYEKAERKLVGQEPWESGDSERGIIDWKNKLEKEIKDQNYYNSSVVSQQSIQPTKSDTDNSNSSISAGKLALISGVIVTVGVSIHFLVKSRKKVKK